MPPSIKPCRTCRATKQAAFLEPVADENSKAVLRIRYGADIHHGLCDLD